MSVTQQEIADHLDLSQVEVSKFLNQSGIDWKNSTMDFVRIEYVRKLRAQAAGHRSEDGLDLVRERVLTERVDRELKQFTLAEKKATLINVAQLEPALMEMVGAFKSELLSRDDKLKDNLDTLYDIDIDIQLLNDYTYAAFNHLARYDAGRRADTEAHSASNEAGGEDQPEHVGAQASSSFGQSFGEAG